MDAATFLVTYAFLMDLRPFPTVFLVLLLLAVMFRFGWNVANDVRLYRRVGRRFSRIR